MGIQWLIVKSWRASGPRPRPPPLGSACAVNSGPSGTLAGALSIAEQHRMHDAAGPEGEESCDHQCAGKQAHHGLAVVLDAMTHGMNHRRREHDQREDR